MFIARLHQRFRKQNLVHNQIEKKTNKNYMFHGNWLIKLSPLVIAQKKFFNSAPLCPHKDSKENYSNAAPATLALP